MKILNIKSLLKTLQSVRGPFRVVANDGDSVTVAHPESDAFTMKLSGTTGSANGIAAVGTFVKIEKDVLVPTEDPSTVTKVNKTAAPAGKGCFDRSSISR